MVKIVPLTIKANVHSEEVEIFPTLLQIGYRNYLVDCGYLETTAKLESSLITHDVKIASLHGVILTHDDHDHLGGLQFLKERNRDLKVYSGRLESVSISGRIKSERLIQYEASLPHLNEEQKIWANHHIQHLRNLPRFPVDYEFEDYELFEGEISVIYTPGHTKGHISLFVEKQKILIAGDALVVQSGTLDLANPEYTLDLLGAVQSVEKIRTLGPEQILCYHGGQLDLDIDKHLEALINKYKAEYETSVNT